MIKKFKFLILILSFFSNNAFAGAWMKKKGESELDFKYEYKTLLTYYDDLNGQKYPSKIYEFDIYSLYYQYGTGENMNLIIEEKWFNYKGYKDTYLGKESESYNFFNQTELTQDNHYRKFENNPYESKFLLQTSLWSSESSIISIQSGLDFYNNNLDRALQINLLYGHSFKLGKEYSYINIEAGIEENTSDSTTYEAQDTYLRLEATLGLTITPKQTLLLQLYNSNSSGIFRDQNVNLGQISWVYKYNQNISWQTGYSTNLTKRDKYKTMSIITGIMFKF